MIGNLVAGTLSTFTPFSPADISNLYLWLDADDASTFTYSSGVVISQWNDKSGNGRNATQATVSRQPTRATSPARVVFDGSNDVINTSATYDGNIFTTFVVCRFSSTTQQTLIGFGTGGTQIYFPFYDGASGPKTFYLQTDAGFGTFSDTVPASSIEVEIRYDGTGSTKADKMKFRYEGSDRTLSFTGSIVTTLARSGQSTSLGAFNTSASLPLNGYISEIVTYNKVLSGTELTQVRNYLGAKWGVTV
jgi:hypothetical protein